MCARLEAHVEEPVGGFTDASIDGLLRAAAESPAGFRLLFHHALREPEFKDRIEKFRADITAAAYLQISAFVPDELLARWAAQLAPAVAIEAISAWLEAGQPQPALAPGRVRQVVVGPLRARPASPPHRPLPPPAPVPRPAHRDGQASGPAPPSRGPASLRPPGKSGCGTRPRPATTSRLPSLRRSGLAAAGNGSASARTAGSWRSPSAPASTCPTPRP